MTLSGWCMSHGRPDQWHDECERRGVVCECPNHRSDPKEIRRIGYDGGINKDGPERGVGTSGRGLADWIGVD